MSKRTLHPSMKPRPARTIAGPAYRVVNVLGDGRRVYFSKRGMIHLMSEAEACRCVALTSSPGNIPAYSMDLGFYGSVSLFTDAFQFYARVVAKVAEPADEPIPANAFIMGGIRADSAPSFDERSKRD